MEESVIVSISDLLRLSSPLSGVFSLHSRTSPSSSSPPRKKRKTLENPSPSPKTLALFNNPVLLVGTVDLPSPLSPCKGYCFSFSDGSSRVCCSLLDLRDLSFLGSEIHVLAWNFLPSKHDKCGVLEIIRWVVSPAGPKIQPSLSVSLKPHNLTVFGALKSVSPIFSVPCRNPGSSGDSIGFLAEIVTCSCDLCRNYDPKNSQLELGSHSFAVSNFLYFLAPDSKWRPMLNMLVGKLVVISGLKKKLIFVGEKASYELFMATAATAVSLCQLPFRFEQIWKDELVYTGVVTALYMHGMAFELDHMAWLVVTDPNIAPSHSVRVGSIITVRNFHLVRPKFSWIQMQLFGACARTSIGVKSFSFPDTRSYVRTESQSMLQRFIGSLTVSAKFWMLLLISCFRRKFGKLLSNKEILGSKNQEGLAQVYASRHLDSCFFRSQQGIFKEFCKHGECPCENESNMSLKLVTPISNLVSKCEALWASKISETQCDAETIRRDGYGECFTNKVNTCYCTIRRIVSSEDLCFILMGSLKVSSSGRLQLVDATGIIDIVVPDLSQNIDHQNIYEVKVYKLIMEGLPVQSGCIESHSAEAFSCRNIFEPFPSKKVLNHFTVYVLFYLRDSTCLNVPLQHPFCKSEDDILNIIDKTTYILLVTHKFPATESDDPVRGDQPLSSNSVLYAEAIILPYKLLLHEEDDGFHAKVSLSELHKESNNVEQYRLLERSKSFGIRSREAVNGSNTDPGQVQQKLQKIPCLFTFRSMDGEGSPVLRYLCDMENTSMGNTTGKYEEGRVLLEFRSDSFFKYQSVQPGGYYIFSCSDSGQCDTVVGNITKYGKITVTSHISLWSLSLSFGESMQQRDPSQSPHVTSSFRGSEACVDVSEGTVIFQESLSQMHRDSDICVHLFSEMRDIFGHFSELGKVSTVSSCVQIMKAGVGRSSSDNDPQCRAMPQGDLISLYGNIEEVHMLNCRPRTYVNSKQSGCLDTGQMMNLDIVIHVRDDHHKLQIHGNTTKYLFPLGMGPGANATFHRVLLTWPSIGVPLLQLTPASFVVINSIKESGHQHGEKSTTLETKFNVSAKESSGPQLSVFSQWTQHMDRKLCRFNCRVMAVCVLVLELPAHIALRGCSKKHLKFPAFNISLAGFVLDDGSSLSHCWANGDTAEKVLRLHEITHRPFLQSHRESMKVKVAGSQPTVGHLLGKMLKKHHRIIVKNNRVAPDPSVSDFSFIVDSREVFSCSEERLLRFIMLRASIGSPSNIIGTVMDLNALHLLDAELRELHIGMPPSPNIWIAEVGYLNPLNEVRDALHNLSS